MEESEGLKGPHCYQERSLDLVAAGTGLDDLQQEAANSYPIVLPPLKQTKSSTPRGAAALTELHGSGRPIMSSPPVWCHWRKSTTLAMDPPEASAVVRLRFSFVKR